MSFPLAQQMTAWGRPIYTAKSCSRTILATGSFSRSFFTVLLWITFPFCNLQGLLNQFKPVLLLTADGQLGPWLAWERKCQSRRIKDVGLIELLRPDSFWGNFSTIAQKMFYCRLELHPLIPLLTKKLETHKLPFERHCNIIVNLQFLF